MRNRSSYSPVGARTEGSALKRFFTTWGKAQQIILGVTILASLGAIAAVVAVEQQKREPYPVPTPAPPPVQPDIFPILISTHADTSFVAAHRDAWSLLNSSTIVNNETYYYTALDAVERGGAVCEYTRCGTSVGPRGSVNQDAETTLDAMIMDGTTMRYGAVMCLKNITHAVRVARYVMEYTTHSILAGWDATRFAVQMGMELEDISGGNNRNDWLIWVNHSCNPNYYINTIPASGCLPKRPAPRYPNNMPPRDPQPLRIEEVGHDTVSMLAIDRNHTIAAATTTNGRSWKIPGRVGDSPVVGAGGYADNENGACGGTGDGDVMVRFLPCYHAVNAMRLGMSAQDAAVDALRMLVRKVPTGQAAIIVTSRWGEVAAAQANWPGFRYVYSSPTVYASVREAIAVTA